ncbi:hypothetical protein M3484_10270 [Pseudomonas sp. GX19020]|uniref:hypothetical protein n=1 Tax=Pseudomonas sp. GX19020 TaxID=2942277 RepID=UPI002019396B|nr:hypothetical protein [Pseudomonas sp. GX19020]MCL4066956.1 hypothetical protein [Pseudomonas sp. GX19020]
MQRAASTKPYVTDGFASRACATWGIAIGDGRRFRSPDGLDIVNSVSQRIEADVSRPADRIIGWRIKPATKRGTKGREYISGKLLIRASAQGIAIRPVRPGLPWLNACTERCNRIVLQEWPEHYVIESSGAVQGFAA